MLFRIFGPFYGLSESYMHWFTTYHGHHRHKLSMVAAAHDLCLLYTPKCFGDRHPSSVPLGITSLQTYDTLNMGNKAFVIIEDSYSKEFECKGETTLVECHHLFFNVITIV